MSKEVHKLAMAVKRIETAQKDDLTLDDELEYEAVRFVTQFARRALELKGAVGSLLLEVASGR